MRTIQSQFVLFGFVLLLVIARSAAAQPVQADAKETTESEKSTASSASLEAMPFGANLFEGTYQGHHQDGRNANYQVMPGDRVVVNTWGALEVNQIFVVDGQGNIFLPSIGPIPLAGVKNKSLTRVVKAQIARVYRSGVGVYTNLLTAAPVGVYVTGGVERPGRYAGVPADSVLFFLNQAGGIAAGAGSYRSISILRDNKAIAEVRRW
jgi:protein involved in polysaccharide export with SLBB domain